MLKASLPLPAGVEKIEVTATPLAAWSSNDYRKPALPPPTAAEALTGDASQLPSARDYDKEMANARRGYVRDTALTDRIPGPSAGTAPSIAWDIPSYQFLDTLDTRCPTIHPNLLRQEQMNNVNGLFVVLYADGTPTPPSATLYPPEEGEQTDIANAVILQIRSYDLATMSFVRSHHGWIVIDPMGGVENVQAGLARFRRFFSADVHPIVAVLVTHSHVDHYRGIQALAAEGHPLVDAGKAEIVPPPEENNGQPGYETIRYLPAGNDDPQAILYIAPAGFYDEAVSENLYLGNSMTRRSAYMYGRTLRHDERGHVGSGLGKTVGDASGGLYKPSVEIDFPAGDIRTLTVDGLTVSFLDAHDSEAPSEYHLYFHDYHTLCPGENITHTMHNLLTCRGAKIRNPKAFALAIDRSLEEWGEDICAIAGTHHWPVWGKDNCRETMESQRDMYRFFNDQVIHGINRGLNMEEIAEHFVLPPSLASKCGNRGYYGSLNHNVKAVFQYYVGWWDGNPANYFRYPEAEAACRFVHCMGGAPAVMEKARSYFAAGDYRWTVELTRQAVFALDTKAATCDAATTAILREACYLQADALEQLAYGFEAGTWRNIFLTAAKELREGRRPSTPAETLIDHCAARLAALEPEQGFEYLSILVDGSKMMEPSVAGKEPFVELDVAFQATEPSSTYRLTLCHGVLHAKALSADKMPGAVPLLVCHSMDDFANAFARAMREAHSLPPKEREGSQPLPEMLVELCRYLEVPEENWEIVFGC